MALCVLLLLCLLLNSNSLLMKCNNKGALFSTEVPYFRITWFIFFLQYSQLPANYSIFPSTLIARYTSKNTHLHASFFCTVFITTVLIFTEYKSFRFYRILLNWRSAIRVWNEKCLKFLFPFWMEKTSVSEKIFNWLFQRSLHINLHDQIIF